MLFYCEEVKMEIENQINELPIDLQKAINHIDKSWELEGYKLTDSDKQTLIDIANGKKDSQVEIAKILSKYKKDNKNG